MKIRFRRFRPEDRDAIGRLNQRLRDAGLEHVVGSEPGDAPEATLDDRPIIERMFVAAEDEEIRGAVWLKEQLFWSGEGLVRAGWMIYPVSESLAEKRFAGVPGTLLFGLLRQQPRLMALGMGGRTGPFARLLEGAGWATSLVPFWFRVLNPSRVARQVSVGRSTRARRAITNALADSGLALLGHGILAGLRRAVDGRRPGDAKGSEVERFEDWADVVWERCRGHYGFAAVRDRRTLNFLYPSDFPAISRLRARDSSGRDLGWVCAQAVDTKGTRLEAFFGDLRLGILTDGVAAPSDATGVMGAGLDRLADERADLVITHQTHPAWQRAVRSLGFWKGPSNVAFSWSPDLAKVLRTGDGQPYLTRGDCDGPEWLDSP